MKQDRLSYSALREFAKSPNHYLLYQEARIETEAMILGQAFHCYVLEYDKFTRNFAVAPNVDRRTKVGKDTYAAFKEASGDKKVIKEQDLELIKVMTDAVMDNDRASELLFKAQYEVRGEKAIGGYDFLGYADILNTTIGFAADLKTCRDASPEAFLRDAYNSDYHLQAVIYKELFNVDDFFWIAVEKERPNNVGVYFQGREAETKSRVRLQRLIKEFIEWDGTPSSYSSNVVEINLPRWA